MTEDSTRLCLFFHIHPEKNGWYSVRLGSLSTSRIDLDLIVQFIP